MSISIPKKLARPLANAGLLLTALIWGSAFVSVKTTVVAIPPLYMMAFRFTIATLALGLLFIRRLKKATLADLTAGALLGVLMSLAYYFQTVGIQFTTAGKNAFFTTVYVVIVPFLQWFMNKKRPASRNWVASVAAIVGIGLLSLQNDLTIHIGDALTLLCGLTFAVHMIYIARFTQTRDPIVLTVLQLATSMVLCWVAAPLVEGGFPADAFRPDIVGSILYLGLASTMVCYLLQNVCQKYTQPSNASVLLSFESVFGVLFSTVLLGEVMTLRMAAGCALIFGAVLISEGNPSFFREWLSRRRSALPPRCQKTSSPHTGPR